VVPFDRLGIFLISTL